MAEPKLATCCFCGRRTILRLSAHGGHALACGSCGAPLHVMKPLRPAQAERVASHAPAIQPVPAKRKGKKRKKKKPLWRKALEEVWDEIEDIFD